MKIRRLIGIGLLSSLALSNQAFAQDVSWQQISFNGTSTQFCKTTNLTTLFNGNSAAFLFSNIAVHIRSGVSINYPLPITCMTRTRMTIPQGFAPSTFFAPTTGGVLKETGIYASLTSRIYIFNAGTTTPFVARNGSQFLVGQKSFATNVVANEPLFEVLNETTFSSAEKSKFCQSTKTTAFPVDLSHRFELNAIRFNTTKYLDLEINAQDVVVNLEPCS